MRARRVVVLGILALLLGLASLGGALRITAHQDHPAERPAARLAPPETSDGFAYPAAFLVPLVGLAVVALLGWSLTADLDDA